MKILLFNIIVTINRIEGIEKCTLLSFIENLWFELQTRVEKHNAKTLDELQNAIAEEWSKTSLNLLQKLSHSMHTRCEAIIACNGQHIKY